MLRSQVDRATPLPSSDLCRLAILALLAVVILVLDMTLLLGATCGVLYMAVIFGSGWLSLSHHTTSAAGFPLLVGRGDAVARDLQPGRSGRCHLGHRVIHQRPHESRGGHGPRAGGIATAAA